jgi:hypothetical protein
MQTRREAVLSSSPSARRRLLSGKLSGLTAESPLTTPDPLSVPITRWLPSYTLELYVALACRPQSALAPVADRLLAFERSSLCSFTGDAIAGVTVRPAHALAPLAPRHPLPAALR